MPARRVRESQAPVLGTGLGRKRKLDLEAIRRQQGAGAFRPFDQQGGAAGEVGETDLHEFRWLVDPVKVDVDHREPRQVVGLHQRERRARHLQARVAGELTDQRARKRGLADAEIARERNHVAGRQGVGKVGRQPAGRRLARQHPLRFQGDADRAQHRPRAACLLRRYPPCRLFERKHAAHRGAAPLRGFELYDPAMKLDKGAHDR